MNKTRQMIAATLWALALPALSQAADKEDKPTAPPAAQTTPAEKPQSMADLPYMKEEAKRLTALMERLQKATDPAERRRIMAETSCAQ